MPRTSPSQAVIIAGCCGTHEKKSFILCIHTYFGCLVPDVHQGGPGPKGGHGYGFYSSAFVFWGQTFSEMEASIVMESKSVLISWFHYSLFFLDI